MTTLQAMRTAPDDDATLAIAAASGDRAAFAAIYDRYADRLHDFCVGMLRDRDAAADCVQDVFVTAAGRLVQLREPERLRSWLYAIARNEALARIRDRRREQPSEQLPETPSSEPDLATLAARSELADLISDACGGLSDRDQVVLELSYRQGLTGPELADALGVTNRNANTLVERLRETVARSLGALLVCRQVRADPSRCPELAAIIEHWDGQFTVLMRKRAARHIETCAICEEQRARMVTPAALLGAAPLLVPAPGWLRKTTLANASQALPSAPAGAPAADSSWWPPQDLDTTDLPDPAPTSRGYLRRHLWSVTAVAAVVVAGVAVFVSVPRFYTVDPTTATSVPASARPAITTAPSPGPTPNPGPTGPTVPPPPTTTATTTSARNEGGPVVPPGNPAGPVAPPTNPGGPVVPPGNPAGPVVPPRNPGGPVVPPGNPAGPVQPPGSSGGPVVAPNPPKPPLSSPKSPGDGPVIPPGRTPPSRSGGPNSCTPPACVQPVGPLG